MRGKERPVARRRKTRPRWRLWCWRQKLLRVSEQDAPRHLEVRVQAGNALRQHPTHHCGTLLRCTIWVSSLPLDEDIESYTASTCARRLPRGRRFRRCLLSSCCGSVLKASCGRPGSGICVAALPRPAVPEEGRVARREKTCIALFSSASCGSTPEAQPWIMSA